MGILCDPNVLFAHTPDETIAPWRVDHGPRVGGVTTARQWRKPSKGVAKFAGPNVMARAFPRKL